MVRKTEVQIVDEQDYELYGEAEYEYDGDSIEVHSVMVGNRDEWPRMKLSSYWKSLVEEHCVEDAELFLQPC